MRPQESARLVAAISAVFPRWKPSKETVAMYGKLLEDLDANIAAEAVTELLKTAEWEPKPAEIREAYALVRARRERARALPETSSAEITEEERQENLRRIRAYAEKIGIPVGEAA